MRDETPKRVPPQPAVPPSDTREVARGSTRPNTAPPRGPSGTHVQSSQPDAQGATHPDMRGGIVIPGYEMLGELGRGAMGVVFRARQVKLNRVVALKMAFGSRVDDKDLIRFLAEAEAVASVKHENVVQVYDYGDVGGQPYMALEFCLAGSLAEVIKEEGRLDPIDAAETVGRIAEGVAAAHELGIVHRDLKPANILLQVDRKAANLHPDEIATLPLEELTPKVSDFGLAKRAAVELTATQAVMGTPAYMSPEQAVGKTKFVGPPADVWALGVIMYECLTGHRPFRGESTYEVLAQILTDNPTPVRKLRPQVPSDLDLVCRKCLEKNPVDRYPTARELADDLSRFVRGEPISVRPLSTAALARRWVKRNPVVTGLLGLVVLVTFGLLGSLYAQNRQATARAAESEKREVAERERAEAKVAEAEAIAATARANAAVAEANAATARARTQAEQVNTLLKLMNELFRSPDPLATYFGEAGAALGVAGPAEGGAGVLGPFLRAAAAEFRGPGPDAASTLVRAKLLASIGNGMKSLGMYSEAKPLFDEALALRRKHLPETHPDVWESEFHLGRMEVESGDGLAAVERFRRLLAAQKKARADRATLLNTRFHEAVALISVGMPEGGEVLKEVLNERQSFLARNHKDVILVKIALISFLIDQGRSGEVTTLFGELREEVKTVPDERIREIFGAVLDAQVKLAIALTTRRQPAFLRPAAAGLKADTIKLEKLLPEDHLILCVFRFELAVFATDLGEKAEADALFARVLADTRKTVGLAHPKVLLLLEAYSRWLAENNRAAEARALFDDVEKANRERFGPENPWLTMILLKRARFEHGQGAAAKATKAAKDAVELVQREKFLPTLSALVELFETARQLGQATDPQLRAAARDLFTNLRPVIGKVYGERSNEMMCVLVAEGEQLYASGNRRAAAASLEAAQQIVNTGARVNLAEYANLQHWSGRLALDRGLFVEAERQFRAGIATSKRVSGYPSEEKLRDAEFLARAVAAQGRFADAVPLFEEVRRLVGTKAPEPNLTQADMQVATAQLGAGRRAEYEKTLAKMVERAGQSTDANVLSKLAWAGGLGGKSAGWDVVAFEAQFAAALKPETVNPWAWRGLALVRVRAGKFDEVEAALSKVGPVPHATDHLIRGLVALARDDAPGAKAALAKAEALLAEERPTPTNLYGYAGRDWNAQVEAAILMAELRAALGPRPKE
jgi:tetratricopeptide (TPR) repeat protein